MSATTLTKLDCIIQAMEPDESNAYIEARRTFLASDEFDRESNAESFLQVEGCDYVRAARRLAKYWKLRSHYLDSQAFQSIDQIEPICASLRQHQYHDLGFMTINASPAKLVLIVRAPADGSPCSKTHETDRPDPPCAQALFCFLSACATNFHLLGQEGRTKSNASLVCLSSLSSGFDRETAKMLVHLITEAFPLDFQGFHLACCVEDRPLHLDMLDGLMPDAISLVGDEMLGYCHAHLAHSRQGLIESLSRFGIALAGVIPDSDSGTSSTNTSLIDEARAIARNSNDRTDDAPISSSSFNNDEHDKQDKEPNNNVRGGAGLDLKLIELARTIDLSTADDAAKEEYYRKRNALYSRRKYLRKKVEITELTEQCNSLRAANASLAKCNDHLEALLAGANRLIGLHHHEPPTTRTSRAR